MYLIHLGLLSKLLRIIFTILKKGVRFDPDKIEQARMLGISFGDEQE
ncbi:hypothetical protein [Dubosiella newyorkensis]|nr:hypothetical protein [Dubosiella newyorkensis]